MPKSPSYAKAQRESRKVISLDDWKLCKANTKQVTVIISDYQDEISSEIIQYLQSTIGNDLNLVILRARTIEELYELSADGSVDIFIVGFENIVVPGTDSPIDRLKTTLQFISYSKTRWKKPIIVYSGLGHNYDELTHSVISIADCYLELPLNFDKFRSALMNTISRG